MNILYTSHKGLPDPRIEREAYIAKKHGHHVFFLGLGSTKPPNLDVFERILMLPRINYPQVVFSRTIRRLWKNAVSSIEPSLIHANDIIAAQFSSFLPYPMIYDDHEYWSAQRIAFKNLPLRQRISSQPFLKIIPIWERQLLKNHVTITVSERIALEHRRFCSHVFVLQNFCLLDEVKNIPENPHRTGIAYIGSDFKRPTFSPHRNMEGLINYVSFDTFTNLPRQELYIKLSKYQYGLLPFKTTSYAKYSNSSKTFDYLNCGLEVLMTQSLYDAHGKLPYTIPFDNYSDICNILSSHQSASPREIMSYAHRNLVWEAQEDKLLEAYNLAIDLY